MHRFRNTEDGQSYDVSVEDLGQTVDPAHGLPPPVMVASAPATPAAAPAAPPLAAVPAGAGAIVAPLGGAVVSIDVLAGRDVAVGDKVATIEAMKMKTEVRSKLAGKVTSIAVKANDTVETGQVLMTVG
jgi:biotin carboxyl carrier protein